MSSNNELGNGINAENAIRITQNQIIYEINKEDNTAHIVNHDSATGEVFIPQKIKYQSLEYVITSIKELSFQLATITSIKFPENSKVKKIGKNALYGCTIEDLTIPASVEELEEGWCGATSNLISVKVMPNNLRYKAYDGKYIIGKSDIKSKQYDTLNFVSRDVTKAIIPSFITRISSDAFSETLIEEIVIPKHLTEIGSNAFFKCKNLSLIEIPENSELRVIESQAFAATSIVTIFIPSHVTCLSSYTFYFCVQLRSITFAKNSELKYIDKEAFYGSSLESLEIPSSAELKDGWCANTLFLKNIKIMPNHEYYSYYQDKFIIGKSEINIDEFDVLIFARRDLKEAEIPPFIKKIYSNAFEGTLINYISIPPQIIQLNEYAFSRCRQISIEFSLDSQLQIIPRYCFAESFIEKVIFPPSIMVICENAFYNCPRLHSVGFSKNSKIHTIEKEAFACSTLKNISIPSSVSQLKDGWCCYTRQLINVTILPNGQENIKYYENKFLIGKSDITSDEYDKLLFVRRNIKMAVIPTFIKQISPWSFANTRIRKIEIPRHITNIGESAFQYCFSLKRVEFQTNSELKKICKNTFSSTAIESFYIPSNIRIVHPDSFTYCDNLRIIESNKHFKDKIVLNSLHHAIIMVPMK